MNEIDKMEPLERVVLLIDLLKKFPMDIELVVEAFERGEVDKDTFSKMVLEIMRMAMELQVRFGKLIAKKIIGEMESAVNE